MVIETLQFLGIEHCKARLNISVDDDGFDDQLYPMIELVNRSLSLELAPLLGNYADLTGTELFWDCSDIAFYYFMSLFYADINHSLEESDRCMVKYKDGLKTLKKAIISDRPNRTRLAIFSSDPQNDRITLPGQKYDSILD